MNLFLGLYVAFVIRGIGYLVGGVIGCVVGTFILTATIGVPFCVIRGVCRMFFN